MGSLVQGRGPPKRIYRVTPVEQLEAKRKALEFLGALSLRNPKTPKAPHLKVDQSFLDLTEIPNTEELGSDNWWYSAVY